MDGITKFKIFFTAAITAAGTWLGTIWHYFAFALAAMIIDYITGIMAGRINEGLQSGKAFKGLEKKIGMLLFLFLGFLIDGAFNYFIGAGFPFEAPFHLPIGPLVSAWVFIAEAISVCENIERLGAPIPKVITNLLKKSKSNIYEED
ncbi:MAG: phage holin family protein [Eubacterium sp.]|nr:phage holin family protein [Eubacterium sp.]